MKRHSHHNWIRITSDGVAVHGPCLVSHISGDGSAAGNVATIYDGLDAGQGAIFCTLEVAANQHQPLNFDPPVVFDHGVYVDLTATGAEVVIAYRQVTDAWLKASEAE